MRTEVVVVCLTLCLMEAGGFPRRRHLTSQSKDSSQSAPSSHLVLSVMPRGWSDESADVLRLDRHKMDTLSQETLEDQPLASSSSVQSMPPPHNGRSGLSTQESSPAGRSTNGRSTDEISTNGLSSNGMATNGVSKGGISTHKLNLYTQKKSLRKQFLKDIMAYVAKQLESSFNSVRVNPDTLYLTPDEDSMSKFKDEVPSSLNFDKLSLTSGFFTSDIKDVNSQKSAGNTDRSVSSSDPGATTSDSSTMTSRKSSLTSDRATLTSDTSVLTSDKRGRGYKCDFSRVTIQMIIEYLRTRRICGYKVNRMRFGLGGK